MYNIANILKFSDKIAINYNIFVNILTSYCSHVRVR